jgi:transposase-like protein
MDLRERVIEAGASRRETAEQFGLSPSVVIIWAQRYRATGSVAPKPSGGSVSPLEEHEDFILGLIEEQPDMTLDEIVAAMAKAKIPGSRTAVWRFLLLGLLGIDTGSKLKACLAQSPIRSLSAFLANDAGTLISARHWRI